MEIGKLLLVKSHNIAAKCLRALSRLFSPNSIDQTSCKLGLVLACVCRIQHDDWSTGWENIDVAAVLSHVLLGAY